MIAAIARWWRNRLRNTDLDILGPIIEREAQTPEQFALCWGTHIGMDSAWHVPLEELSAAQRAIVDRCTPYWKDAQCN